MIEDADPSEHPRVNVALEFQEFFGFGKAEGQIRTAGHLRLVEFLVAGRRPWNVVHIMQHRIRILDLDFLSSLDRQDLWDILAAFLIQRGGWRGSAAGFAADALD